MMKLLRMRLFLRMRMRQGGKHMVESGISGNPALAEVGEVIEVLYQVDDPSDGVLNHWASLWGLSIGMFIISFGLIIIGCVIRVGAAYRGR